jgi:hypothetical protein
MIYGSHSLYKARLVYYVTFKNMDHNLLVLKYDSLLGKAHPIE